MDALLEKYSSAHQQELPKNTSLYYFVGSLTAVLPTYLFQGVHDLDFLTNLPIYAIMIGVSVWLLVQAYDSNFESQHLKYKDVVSWAPKAKDSRRDRKAILEAQRQQSEAEEELRGLKHQASLSYALMCSNLIFYGVVLLCHYYILKTFEPRLNYAFTYGLAGILVYWLADENRKTVQKRASKTK